MSTRSGSGSGRRASWCSCAVGSLQQTHWDHRMPCWRLSPCDCSAYSPLLCCGSVPRQVGRDVSALLFCLHTLVLTHSHSNHLRRPEGQSLGVKKKRHQHPVGESRLSRYSRVKKFQKVENFVNLRVLAASDIAGGGMCLLAQAQIECDLLWR